MEDLDTRIRRLSDLDRRALVDALIRIDAEAQKRARRGRRARIGTRDRERSNEARYDMARPGAIIHFLRFRTHLPERDAALCQFLEEKLFSKGQWTGDIES
jgi:hypothetical protein